MRLSNDRFVTKKSTLIVFLISVFLVNCVTGYRGVDYENLPKQYTKTAKQLNYRIFGSTGMPRAIEKVLRENSYFQDALSVDKKPEKGIYVEVSINQVNPPASTIAWGYFSYVTLFIIPSWDTQYGFDVQYDLYIDGTKKKQYLYEIKRGTYLSVFLLPFVWLSLMRPGEEEAFVHSAFRFLNDSRQFFGLTP
jgi:hypothetical protein